VKSSFQDVMPPRLRRGLAKLGGDLNIARKKRALTIEMMAERTGVSRTTYLRAEKGDPNVAMGVYAMALFALGFHEALEQIADSRRDETGLQLDTQRLPKRVRTRKGPLAL
jgi:DNA-binding XRE family transcriptional regulator